MARRDPAARALSWGQRGRRSPASLHPGAILAGDRAFAVGAGNGLSWTETFSLPEQPRLPCERRHLAHACREAGWGPPRPREGLTATGRGLRARPAPLQLPRRSRCGQVKDNSEGAPGLCQPLAAQQRLLQAACTGQRRQRAPDAAGHGQSLAEPAHPAGHGRIHPVGPGPSPAPRP